MDPQKQNEVFLRQHRVEKKGIEDENIRLRVEPPRDKPEKRSDRVVHAATANCSPSGMPYEKIAIGHMIRIQGYRQLPPLQVVLDGTKLASGTSVARGTQLHTSLASLRHVPQD